MGAGLWAGGGEHPPDGWAWIRPAREGSRGHPSLLRLQLVIPARHGGAQQPRAARHCGGKKGKGRQAHKIPCASWCREHVPAHELPAAAVSAQEQQGGC